MSLVFVVVPLTHTISGQRHAKPPARRRARCALSKAVGKEQMSNVNFARSALGLRSVATSLFHTEKLFPAKKFPERLKNLRNRFRNIFQAIGKFCRFTAMAGAGLSRNLVRRQDNFVSAASHFAAGRSQGIRSRAYSDS